MRRWIALAARLYPRAWRERYGEEFDALLDDATADCRQLLNVSRSAIAMQLTRHIGELKLVGALALAGALLAIAASYRVPPRYVSSAVVAVVPVVDPGATAAPGVLERQTQDRIERLTTELTARVNILRILKLPSLDLYRAEREEMPVEDLADRIRDDGDIQAQAGPLPGRNGAALRVSFAYRDRAKAQAAVRELVAELQPMNHAMDQENALTWAALWSQPLPFQERIDLVRPANIPTRFPLLIRIAAGTGAGLLLAGLALLFRRRPKFLLQIAACGLAGFAVAGCLSLLVRERIHRTCPAIPDGALRPEACLGIGPHHPGERSRAGTARGSPRLRHIFRESERAQARLRRSNRGKPLPQSKPGVWHSRVGPEFGNRRSFLRDYFRVPG